MQRFWLSLLCSELDLTAQNLLFRAVGHPGEGGGCQVNLGMNGFRATKEERRSQGSYSTEGKGPRKRHIQHSTPWPHFCLRRSPCYVFLSFFLLVLKREAQKFSWENDWHIGIPAPCSLLQRAQIPWIFSYHICCVGSIPSVCVCVPVCACDYKSHSANRTLGPFRANLVSVVPHARQMMMLLSEKYNIIFFCQDSSILCFFQKTNFSTHIVCNSAGVGGACTFGQAHEMHTKKWS